MTERHKIPVLNVPEVTDDDFEHFADCLALYAKQWIPEIAIPIMRAADQLFEMPTFRLLLGEWYEANHNNIKGQRERLMRAATHTEYLWEREGEDEEFDGNLYTELAKQLNDTLRMLLVDC